MSDLPCLQLAQKNIACTLSESSTNINYTSTDLTPESKTVLKSPSFSVQTPVTKKPTTMAMLSSGIPSALGSQDKDRQGRSINSKSYGTSVRPPPHYPLSWLKQQKLVGSVLPDDSPMKAQVAFLGAVDQLRYKAQLKQKHRAGVSVQFQATRALKPCSSRASSCVECTESHRPPCQQELAQTFVKKSQPANMLAKHLVLSASSPQSQSSTPTTTKLPPRPELNPMGPSHSSCKPSLEDIAERNAVSWKCKRDKHAQIRQSPLPGAQMGNLTKNKLESNPRAIGNSQQAATQAGPVELKHCQQVSRASGDLEAGSQFRNPPARLLTPNYISPGELTATHTSIDSDNEKAHKEFADSEPAASSSSADNQLRGIKRKLSIASAPVTPNKNQEFCDSQKLVACRASSAEPRIGNVLNFTQSVAGRDKTDWDSHESEFKRKKTSHLAPQPSLESLHSRRLDKLTIGHPETRKPTQSERSYSIEPSSAACTAKAWVQKPKKMQTKRDLSVSSTLEAAYRRPQSLSPCEGMSTQAGEATSPALAVHTHSHGAQLAEHTSSRHADPNLSGARSDPRSARQFGHHFFDLPKLQLTSSDQAKKVTLPSLSSPLPWPHHQKSFPQPNVPSARAHPGSYLPCPASPPCRAPQVSSSRPQAPTGSAPEKPNFSYAALIGQAIMHSSTKKVSLNEIYGYIAEHYPFYRKDEPGWQNSIRHNLSLNESFVKVPRGPERPGKGSLWKIAAGDEGQFVNGGFKKKAADVSRRGLVGSRKKPKKVGEAGEQVGNVGPSVDFVGRSLGRQEGWSQKPDRCGVKEEHDKERQEGEKGEEEFYIEKAASFEEWEGQSQGTRWESEEHIWKSQERTIDAKKDGGWVASMRGESPADCELPKLSSLLYSPPMKNAGVMMGHMKEETMADPTNQPVIDESDMTFGRPSRNYLGRGRDDEHELKKIKQYKLPLLPTMMLREVSAKAGSRSTANQNTQDQDMFMRSVDEDSLSKRGWSDGEEDGGMGSLKLAPLQNQNILKTPNRSASGQTENSKVKLMSITDLLTTPCSVSSSSSMKLTPLKPGHSSKALDSRQRSGQPELAGWLKHNKDQLVNTPVLPRPPFPTTAENKQIKNGSIIDGPLYETGANAWSEKRGFKERHVPWFGTPAGQYINSSPRSDGEDIWGPRAARAGAHEEGNETGGLGITEQLKRMNWKLSRHTEASQDWVTEEPLDELKDEKIMD